MAKSVIINKLTGRLLQLKAVLYPISSVVDKSYKSSVIATDYEAKNIKSVNHPIPHIVQISQHVKINEVLPFRVRFTTLGIPTMYGPGSAAPIGIAIIGKSNYVM